MAIKVNPPPQQKLPEKIFSDKEMRDYFTYQQEILFKLWLRTGGGEDIISDTAERVGATQVNSQAQLNEINDRLGSGDPLTSDETGFTVDLDTLSVDMTEA